MSNSRGSVLQIVKVNQDAHAYEFSADDLKRVILEESVKNRDVVIVSVAGALRKGKSFLLSFFLRYLYAKYVHKSVDGWLGSDDEPLTGFSWRGGSEPETTGICLWSDVFLHDYEDGRKIAILLMDTQGAFDSNSTVQDCATIFALSTMISSVQIYNLFHNIQEDDLQHLQLFTEYGRVALEEGCEKSFQKLMFLVRDWSFPYEAAYGSVGGKQFLEKRLEVSESQPLEIQSIRRHIKECFDEISCFLMPHPGLDVATSPVFNGKLRQISSEFKEHLQTLIPQILAPKNLIVKEINGQRIKAHDLLHYFESYLKIFKSDDIPKPMTIFNATAEANNLSAMEASIKVYTNFMTECCGSNAPRLSDEEIESKHKIASENAVTHFFSSRKMGGEEFSRVYHQKMLDSIESKFDEYKKASKLSETWSCCIL